MPMILGETGMKSKKSPPTVSIGSFLPAKSKRPYCGSLRGRIDAWILRASRSTSSMRSRAIFWLIEWRRIASDSTRRVALARDVEIEGEQVLALPDLDGGEPAGAERVLELAIEPRIVGFHVHACRPGAASRPARSRGGSSGGLSIG